MNRTTRILCAIFALMLLLGGCALEEAPEAAPEATPTPNAAEDVVIATVNGTPILRSTFESVFGYYYSMYSLYYGADFSDEAVLSSFQDSIFSMMVQAEVLLQEAEKSGITLTAEEIAAAEEQARATYDSVLETFLSQAQAAGAEDVEAEARRLMEEGLAAEGLTDESYREQLLSDVKESTLTAKFQESIYETVTLTEADAEAQFKKEVAAEKKSYTDNPAAFDSAQNTYEAMGGRPPLYTPEGFRRVKHILINITEERPEADALALAKEVYDKAAAGEDFNALMAEYGEDPGMQAEPNKSLGYLTYAGTSFVPEFLEASMALENVGDITEPVKTDYGYHVIKLESFLESGEKTFAEVKEDYMASLLASRQQEVFDQKMTEWVAAADVISDLSSIRDLGKAAG